MTPVRQRRVLLLLGVGLAGVLVFAVMRMLSDPREVWTRVESTPIYPVPEAVESTLPALITCTIPGGSEYAALCCDDRFFACGGWYSKAVSLVRASDGKLERTLPCQSRLRGLHWSPATRLLMVAELNGTVTFWEEDTWVPRMQFRAMQVGKSDWVEDPDAPSIGQNLSEVTRAVMSADGRLLALGASDGTLKIWDMTEPKVLFAIERAHRSWIVALAFSPDNRALVSAAIDDRLVVWDLPPGKISAEWRNPLPSREMTTPDRVTFHPTAPVFATCGRDGHVRLWDLRLRSLGDRTLVPNPAVGWGAPVAAVTFSPDGDLLVAGGVDGTGGLGKRVALVVAWNLKRGREVGRIRFATRPDGPNSLAFGSSQRCLAVSGSWWLQIFPWPPAASNLPTV